MRQPYQQGDLFSTVVFGGPRKARDNEAGRRTSARKLLGQVFTPVEVAERILAMVRWPEGSGILLDPACGDGVFLQAAIRKVLGVGLPTDQVVSILERRLVGWDVDPHQVRACQERLRAVLASAGCPDVAFRVECRDALEGCESEFPETCMVGNPPYLEAKRMPDDLKTAIRAAFPEAADGAFDLFGAFVALALRLTSRGGEICLVLPNRFLTSTYTRRLRRSLWTGYATEVHDLSTERIFPDAAVYPIILHARRLETVDGRGVPDGQGRARGFSPSLLAMETCSDIWPVTPADPDGARLIERLMNDSRLKRLGQIADVRWTVSFHRSGLRDRFVFPQRPPDARFARRFLGGGRFHGNREVQPFRIRWDGWWIDYDEERARVLGNPFPRASLFDPPKVVVCQNARRLRAAVDREGFVLKDTFLAVTPRENPTGLTPSGSPVLEWLCIVLQSNLMHYLYEHVFAGTRKGGGYLQFLPRFLSLLPVAPCPDADAAVRVTARLAAGEPAWEDAEALVLDAFDVNRTEERVLGEFPFPIRAEE